MYVRYKCQPEAQVTQTGWDLSMSQRYADQLALEEQQPYLSEESLLYNGLAPTNIALRIVEAPAEFAVPVKQDRCAHTKWISDKWLPNVSCSCSTTSSKTYSSNCSSCGSSTGPCSGAEALCRCAVVSTATSCTSSSSSSRAWLIRGVLASAG
jgi:hypothetical protein